VTDLDMDFAGLKEMGFAFVELDAPVFLDGLPAASGRIPASDICRHLSDFGLTLIVGRIEDDWLLARILGFGVLYGKGTLFGGPRLVKEEVVAAPAAA
jgi:cyclic-di-GMP phosphodiesterase TipF (flagellum assembly factor)